MSLFAIPLEDSVESFEISNVGSERARAVPLVKLDVQLKDEGIELMSLNAVPFEYPSLLASKTGLFG